MWSKIVIGLLLFYLWSLLRQKIPILDYWTNSYYLHTSLIHYYTCIFVPVLKLSVVFKLILYFK